MDQSFEIVHIYHGGCHNLNLFGDFISTLHRHVFALKVVL